jgi:hypothetical protein
VSFPDKPSQGAPFSHCQLSNVYRFHPHIWRYIPRHLLLNNNPFNMVRPSCNMFMVTFRHLTASHTIEYIKECIQFQFMKM